MTRPTSVAIPNADAPSSTRIATCAASWGTTVVVTVTSPIRTALPTA